MNRENNTKAAFGGNTQCPCNESMNVGYKWAKLETVIIRSELSVLSHHCHTNAVSGSFNELANCNTRKCLISIKLA